MSTAKRLTIRMTASEWETLAKSAGRRPISTYAREKLLGANNVQKRKTTRRPKRDTVLLAQILATLAQRELPDSMRELARASRTGTVPDTGDVRLTLRAACLTIEKMRQDLTLALNVKPE